MCCHSVIDYFFVLIVSKLKFTSAVIKALDLHPGEPRSSPADTSESFVTWARTFSESCSSAVAINSFMRHLAMYYRWACTSHTGRHVLQVRMYKSYRWACTSRTGGRVLQVGMYYRWACTSHTGGRVLQVGMYYSWACTTGGHVQAVQVGTFWGGYKLYRWTGTRRWMEDCTILKGVFKFVWC